MNNYTEKDCFFFEDQLHFDSTEEVFITNIVTCILNSFFSLLTCIGNFIVVFVIGKTRDLHSPSFILLGCLAVSDLLVGLICQPLFVAHKTAELKENFAVFCTLKVLQSLSAWITAGVSLFILAAVLIDRLLALTLHLRYNTIVTVPRVFQTTIALWIFATVTVLPRFWMASKWHFIPIALGVLKFFVIVISVWKKNPNCSKAPTADKGPDYSCQPSSSQHSKDTQVQKISCDSALYLRFALNFLSSFNGTVGDGKICRIYENSKDCL